MYKIIAKQTLAPKIKRMVIQADLVAQKALPGQFAVLIVDQKGERIPLTIVEADKIRKTITVIFQEVGRTTEKLGSLKPDQDIFSLLGPLGKAANTERFGNVVAVGGGVGIAEVYPVTRAFKQNGNQVTAIIGARSKELLILRKELEKTSDRLLLATDDGSCGHKGLVSDLLQEVISSQKLDLVYAVGPVAMMQAVAELTRSKKIKTRVSLNPIMVDATGMCGACRVSLGGQIRFACVDGPEFDAHLVDFDQLNKRLRLFAREEQVALKAPQGKHCRDCD